MRPSKRIAKEFSDLLQTSSSLVDAFGTRASFQKTGLTYQKWYTAALPVVEVLAPDRLDEFRACYLPPVTRKTIDVATYTIQDYIRGISSGYVTDPRQRAVALVSNQIQIFISLADRLESSLADIQGVLLAELQDDEMVTAEQLKRVNLRAAGALAGVLLESHLLRVAGRQKVAIAKKRPTLGDINDALREAGVYDLPMQRRVQFLADLRNICAHKREREPTPSDLDDLLAGVRRIIHEVN